jgi:hypothetical protein
MNANELADKLLGSLTMEYDCDKYMEQAATMLRQQQAEIQALKTENSHLKYEISSGAWNPVPLTDAELSEVYEEVYINYSGKDFPVDLGRAILRKASEK